MGVLKNNFYLFILLLLSACIEPYTPPVTENNVDIMVVDGFINASDNSASVKISRAISLTSIESFPKEQNATVLIEELNGPSFTLVEQAPGLYSTSDVIFSTDKQYRLSIRTTGGDQLESEYINILKAPEIDSISFLYENDEMDVTVNTHDPLNQNKYYQWTFQETWEYTAAFNSFFEWVNGVITLRPPENSIFFCWGNNPSSSILIGSTTSLTQDVIRDAILTSVPKGSRKISRLYSIMVQQRALSKRGYDYFLQLQRSSENLGSLFDPQPSQVTGNIYNKNNSSATVLGFFQGSTVSEKRRFLSFDEIPEFFQKGWVDYTCEADSVPIADINNFQSAVIINSYGMPTVEGYTIAYSCADCRSAGGTTKKPDFWPY